MPPNVLSSYTVPSNDGVVKGSLYLSMDTSTGYFPWSSTSEDNEYTNLASATYIWELTAACGETFQKPVTVTAPKKTNDCKL